MENLSITERRGDNYILITVQGTINSYTFNDFQQKVSGHVNRTNLCIDMSKVSNISSAGLGVLMTAEEDAEITKHKLYILNPSELVRTAIESTGFKELFNIIHSVAEIT
jgi:anti-sigma B factor antagonist